MISSEESTWQRGEWVKSSGPLTSSLPMYPQMVSGRDAILQPDAFEVVLPVRGR